MTTETFDQAGHRETETRSGIPPGARPWDMVKAVLPDGWGVVVMCSTEEEQQVKVVALVIGPKAEYGVSLGARDTYSIALQEPVIVRESELDSRPLWLDQEIARRRAT